MAHPCREAMLLALTCDEIAKGRGSHRQIQAWRELEWRRCAADPVYFLTQYGWIILKDGTLQRWALWPIQTQLLRVWQGHTSVVAVKARQLGVTTLSAHFAFWECLFKEAARWVLISASEEKAKDIISRVQATKDRLPEWVVERARRRDRDVNEVISRSQKSDAMTRISYGLSEMKIVTSTAKSIQGASGSFILDEYTEHSEQKRKLHMLMPAMDGGGMAIVIANGKGEDEFFHLYRNAKDGKNRFKPFFFSWRDDPTRDQAWYDDMRRQYLISNPEADDFSFKSQFPSDENEAFYLTGNSRFKLGVLNDMALRAREVKPQTGILEGSGDTLEVVPKAHGKWRVYEPPVKGAQYVIGADPSGGGNAGDYSALQVLKAVSRQELVQVATFQAKVEPADLAYECVRAGRWYNEAYLVPEANNHGALLIDRIKADYFNLYMRRSKVDHFTTVAADNIGFWTDTVSKKRVIDQLADIIAREWVVLNDSATIAECTHYEIAENGTTNAPKGMNDDCVMALALAVEGAVDMLTFHTNAQVRSLMPWED